MITKYEYAHLKHRISRLKIWIDDYELSSELYDTWNAQKNMPAERRAELQKEWEDYYQKAFENFALQRLTGEKRPSVQKPVEDDPEMVLHEMQGYFDNVSTKESLEDLIKEYDSIYSSKKEDNSL